MPKGSGGLGSRSGTGSESSGVGAQNDFAYGADGCIRFPNGVGVYFLFYHDEDTPQLSDDLGMPGDWAFGWDLVIGNATIFAKRPDNTWGVWESRSP